MNVELLFSSGGGQTGQLGRQTDRKCSNLRSCSERPRRSGQTNANKDRTGVTADAAALLQHRS